MRPKQRIEYYQIKEDDIYFTLDQSPPRYHSAYLSEEIIDWVERNGFNFITIIDSNGRILYTSPSISKTLGHQSSDVVNQYYLQYIPEDLQKDFIDSFQKKSRNQQGFKMKIVNDSGNCTRLHLITKPIYIKDSDEVIFIVLAEEIADEKEIEDLFIRAEQMSVTGLLATGAIHEIRNPLTSIKGFIDLLRAGVNRKDEYFEIILSEIEKLERITTELLSVAKPLTDEFSHLLLKPMINEVATLLNMQAVKKEIDIEIDCHFSKMIYGDRTQVKQVFINLIKNAIEAMEKPGKIRISVKKNNEFCLIQIADEGPGIPEDLINKVEEPFYTTKKDGTGLGMIISSQIIKKHNGLIKILPNQKDGTTFEIHLPTYDPSVMHI